MGASKIRHTRRADGVGWCGVFVGAGGVYNGPADGPPGKRCLAALATNTREQARAAADLDAWEKEPRSLIVLRCGGGIRARFKTLDRLCVEAAEKYAKWLSLRWGECSWWSRAQTFRWEDAGEAVVRKFSGGVEV